MRLWTRLTDQQKNVLTGCAALALIGGTVVTVALVYLLILLAGAVEVIEAVF